MRRLIALGLIVLGLSACATGTPTGGSAQALVDRSTLAVQELLGGDADVLNAAALLRTAQAVMVCPRVFRAAFIAGGEGGDCVLLGRDGAGSWSSPAFYALGSGNIGLQAGIQDAQTLLIIRSERALNAILNGQFKFGADASLAFATLGGSVEGATTTNLGADIVAVSRARGLFAGLALEGTVLQARPEWNQAYYGRDLTARQIVVNMAAHNPGADPLRAILTRFGSGTPRTAQASTPASAPAAQSAPAATAGQVSRAALPPVAR
ncbi:MAG: lipid-binding SYLF domain-containing protein [Rhodovarius sp.]|nr:lipid-binding SYLF domain-containing protein [Rhodovarius sp.]